jgi:hypothetical protein
LLNQILTHTPTYVWAILAVLVWRGAAALRDREMKIRSLFIVPLVMLALSLQDIVMKFGATKFGLGGATLGAWAAAAAATMLLVMKFGGKRTAPGATADTIVVRGSWAPLAMMMAVFFTKYVASVLLAVLPHARQDAVFAACVCALFGVFNGYFLGRLARDVSAASTPTPSAGACSTPA